MKEAGCFGGVGRQGSDGYGHRGRAMEKKNHGWRKRLQVPFWLVLMMTGFLLEFLVELPFAVMCTIERCFRRKPL